jgi:hypothetical protein
MEGAMEKITFILVFLFLVSSCGPAPQADGTISSCCLTLDAISTLTGGLEFPANFQTNNPVKKGGEFDVMQYFKVLDHLSMQTGYVLDYVYHYDGMGGGPILYVRPASQPPYSTEADLAAAGETPDYMDYIQVDDTPESFFQLAMLSMVGSQFYLYWHANYKDLQIICDKVDIKDIVNSLDGDFGYPISLMSRMRAALLTDVAPVVNIGEQTTTVQIITFTRWGGFYKQAFTISRVIPHTILDVQEKNLVPYDCGVMY